MNPTEHILSCFEQVSAIPRGSQHEEKIRDWLIAWADKRSLKSKVDAAGNLVIHVPASKSMEKSPTIILQGHMDMVWQKTPDSTHDFMKDSIRVIRDGDWIKADRTTLGADNGIAIALMMVLVEDESVIHPSLELLLTVEEEFGVSGAGRLDPSLLKGKTLINLDSEKEGVFTVGCAGGGSLYMDFPLRMQAVPKGHAFFQVRIGGLIGGHSGEDINKQRANANKLLARVLDEIQREVPIQLISFKGGTARNAIPRDAETVFASPTSATEMIREKVRECVSIFRAEYAQTEQGLSLSIKGVESQGQAMSLADSQKFIRLLASLPNGVSEMSAKIPGFVETSNNIGIIEMKETSIQVVSNHRSSVLSKLEEITRKVEAIADLAGTKYERTKIFPPWQANPDSALLKQCIQVYEKSFGSKPVVVLSHGGLECGTISDRCGGLDTISLGPTIEAPHSPDERLFVPSLAKTWGFLKALLGSF